MNKIISSVDEAVADITDGATIMLAGHGRTGWPGNLINAVVKKGVKDLTLISCAFTQALPLVEAKLVKKFICTFPIFAWGETTAVEKQYESGQLEVEVHPIGNLIEMIRAGGAGIPALYSPIGVGSVIEEGKEKRTFNGVEAILIEALTADFALIKAHKADDMGNLIYHGTALNFNHIMATAARVTIAEIENLVDIGAMNGDDVHTPGIYVHRVIQVPRPKFAITID